MVIEVEMEIEKEIEMATGSAVITETDSSDQERCIKQYAQNVKRIVKFHSSPPKENPYIAGIVLQSINPRGFKECLLAEHAMVKI